MNSTVMDGGGVIEGKVDVQSRDRAYIVEETRSEVVEYHSSSSDELPHLRVSILAP